MLTHQQINILPERIYQRLNDINTGYLESIGKVLKNIGELRPSDIHKLQQMYNYGADIDRITKKLSDASGKNVKEIYEIFDLVAEDNYKSAEIFYKAKNKTFIPYEQNEDLKQYVHNMAKQTVNEYINLTQHTAFAVFSKDGKSIAPLYLSNKEKMATSLSDTYSKIVDYAVSKVQLGMSSYNPAVKEICEALAKSGIRTVDYATGYKRRLDTTVRQNVLHGIKKCNQNTADKIGEEFGADGYEVSYHSNPRETHADMAGKQYAKGEARTVNGVYYPSFDTVAHLLEEYNCLHFKYSIILGVSQPAYSEEQLRTFKNNDKKTFEFEGKPYTMYDASQLQRKIETAIRHQKDLSVIAKASGNEELQQKAQLKINQLANKYHDLSQASGLPTKVERLTSTVNKKNVHNFIDNSEKSGIMKVQGGKIMNINNIDSPIERRNTAKGNPNAILIFDRPLNNRQQKLLDNLKEYDSRVIVPKKSVNMKDLSALTAVTGDEFALFTKGNERLVIRGNAKNVNIDIKQAKALNEQGYKWSGHTHPGINSDFSTPSQGDREILECFSQKTSVIYNSKGYFRTFEKE